MPIESTLANVDVPKQKAGLIPVINLNYQNKLGQSAFQPEIDKKISQLPSVNHWSNHQAKLLKLINDGGNYVEYTNKQIGQMLPEEARKQVQKQIIEICSLHQSGVRYGKLVLVMGKGGDLNQEDSKGLSLKHQTNAVMTSAVERAFVSEYAKRLKLNFNKAWDQLLSDDRFIHMLCFVGKPKSAEVEEKLRRDLGLSTDKDTIKPYLESSFIFVAEMAKNAGISQSTIMNAVKALGTIFLPSGMTSPPPELMLGLQVPKITQQMRDAFKRLEDEKREEEEKKQYTEKFKRKKKAES